MHEHQLSDGHIAVGVSPNGGLLFFVFRDGETGPERVDQIETCPIVLDGGEILKVALNWREGNITAVHALAAYIFSRDPTLSVAERVFVRKRDPVALRDFSAENEKAVILRRDKAAGWQGKPNRTPGGADYLIAALDDEYRQLVDLTKLASGGREHHLPGIASRVRLLVAGKPLGLLQHVASLKNLPLIIYSTVDPFADDRHGPPLYSFSLHGSPKPTEIEPNPIDLDVWLRAPALITTEKSLSTGDIVKEIGDTIGSHRDVDLVHSVAAMVRRRSLSGRRYNDVERFLSMMTAILIHLSKEVLGSNQAPIA